MKGQFREINENVITYQVPIKEGSGVRTILGEIKKKNDGRYFWYRKNAKGISANLFPNWIGQINGQPVQGVEDTIALAKQRILEGWINEQ